MGAYQHVVVIMSIVLGMAVTQLVKGAAQLYRNRLKVKPYWLHTAWVVLLIFFSLLLWWTFWNYRNIAEWDFLRFVVYLSPIIAFYLVTALAFPDAADPAIDMKAYYFTNRRGFFGAFALYGVLAGLTAMIVRKLPVTDSSNLFRAGMVVLLVIAMKSANQRVHAAVLAISAVLMAIFIAMFQFRIG